LRGGRGPTSSNPHSSPTFRGACPWGGNLSGSALRLGRVAWWVHSKKVLGSGAWSTRVTVENTRNSLCGAGFVDFRLLTRNQHFLKHGLHWSGPDFRPAAYDDARKARLQIPASATGSRTDVAAKTAASEEGQEGEPRSTAMLGSGGAGADGGDGKISVGKTSCAGCGDGTPAGTRADWHVTGGFYQHFRVVLMAVAILRGACAGRGKAKCCSVKVARDKCGAGGVSRLAHVTMKCQLLARQGFVGQGGPTPWFCGAGTLWHGPGLFLGCE